MKEFLEWLSEGFVVGFSCLMLVVAVWMCISLLGG